MSSLLKEKSAHPLPTHSKSTRLKHLSDIPIRPGCVPHIDKICKMAPVSIKRILISESVDACCKKILQENGIEVTEKQNMTKDELIADIKVKVSRSNF